MGHDLGIPATFETIWRIDRPDSGPRPIVVRDGLDGARARALLDAVAAIAWSDLQHAYGPAGDVPAQLAAAIVGDATTRDEAWSSLWSSVLHQGSVYPATAAAVPILLDLARWSAYPDRVEALRMLREARAGDGALSLAGLDPLLDGWRDEPPAVQRALLWVLAVDPELRARHAAGLVAAILPEEHRPAWAVATAGDAPATERDAWAVFALEDWVHDGA